MAAIDRLESRRIALHRQPRVSDAPASSKPASRPADPFASTFEPGASSPASSSSSSAAKLAADRSSQAFQALLRNFRTVQYQFRDTGRSRAMAWSLGQAIAGGLDRQMLGDGYHESDYLLRQLAPYAELEGYTPGANEPSGSRRFYDDNAWLGLDMVQSYAISGNTNDLAQAKRVWDFLQKGKDSNGALIWDERENPRTFNTCVQGPAIELSLRLYMVTHDSKYLDFAKRLDAYMEQHLRGPNGTYIDHVNQNGTRDTTLYTYNQGTPIGADVLFYKVTGDTKYLDRAKQTATAALNYFAHDNGLWRRSPALNAIFFRNLMALDAVAPDPRYRSTLENYLSRAWSEARDPRTGLFDRGGIGSYGEGPGNLIDQGGWVQMYALLAMSPAQLGRVS